MENKEQAPTTPIGGCLVRFFWMIIGNLITLACLLLVAEHKGLTLSPVDLIFWGNVALLVAMRYWDIKSWNGRTGKGKPATMADWKKYTYRLPAIAAALWIGAHLIAYLR